MMDGIDTITYTSLNGAKESMLKKLSIIYTRCCGVVLMHYNAKLSPVLMGFSGCYKLFIYYGVSYVSG